LAFQVFVSYASLDDVAPPSGGDGFVTTLVRYLKFDLDQRKPTPQIWRDRDGKIKPSDQFDEVIDDGIAASELMLVVLSDNWMASDYCRKELNLFAQKSNGSSAKRRIIVAAKHDMKPENRPVLLQGQTAYRFYDEHDPDKPEFFLHKKLDTIDLLIQKIANDIRDRMTSEDPTRHREGPTPQRTRGRRIYLAKPGSDMSTHYRRLAEELEGREYVVVPDKDSTIPLDSMAAAVEYIDGALDGAEFAVHVLGEKPGMAPEEQGATPIVRLQLERARLRGVRRIIWAPRKIGDRPERDETAVLASFDSAVDGDKIVGTEVSEFSDFLVQHLGQHLTRPDGGGIEAIETDSCVYVYYQAKDEDYGLEVAAALQARNIQATTPIFNGLDIDPEWHKQQIQVCDAIVVCWANAGEIWISQQPPEFRDWTKLNRKKAFSCRGIIVGPPGDVKQSFMKKAGKNLPPTNQVDIVLDLSAYPNPTPELLDPLVKKTVGA